MRTSSMASIKHWTKESIKDLLLTNDKAVCRGVVAIFNYQTDIEKSLEAATVRNGVGFNGPDAFILSEFAQFYKKKGFLTPKQIEVARKKIVKYSGQLARIANS